MRTTLALATATMICLPALPAGAQSRVALHDVAARAGYGYHWSNPGSAVVLSRPGTVIVLRPGAPVYQVNDHAEVTDEAPSYSRGDLYVTQALAKHLTALARRYSPAAAPGAETAGDSTAEAHGSISLEARQLQGAEAISIDGNAPSGSQVTVTLLATVSPEVPTIVVSRHDVVTDATGRFGAVIPIASAYERGTLLTIVATSSSGAASASAHLVTDAPNAGASVPLTNH